MATVATSTITDCLAGPTTPAFVRQATTGYLYVAVRTATDTLTIYRSINAGTSWASYASFTHTGLQEWSGLVTDTVGWLHLAYRVGTVTADSMHYRRLNTGTATFSAALLVSDADPNGGVIGSVWSGVDLAVVRNPNGTFAIAMVGAISMGGGYGACVMGVSIDAGGYIYRNDGIITSQRFFAIPGTPTGRTGITCEIEHNGDGFTAATPHLWVTWGRTTLWMVKLAWIGSSVGWQGPSSNGTIIRSPMTAIDYVSGRWDGTQWLMAIVSPDDTTAVRIYQRNAANTSTTTIDTPAHPQGAIRYVATSYDLATRNLRVYAVGTTTSVLYYVDYVRATSTWSAWSTVVATAVLGSGAEWSVRRGGSSGNARHDVITAAAGAPNVVTHTAQVVSTAPAVPSFDLAGKPYLNAGPADVASTLALAWTFSDLDPGQTQGSYALSRQIGAGAIAYWNATTVTWVAGEIQNASVTQGVTLAAAWGLDADATHQYRVKVWDSAGVVAPGYSSALALVPSAVVNPTITAPAAAAVLTADTVTVTWTVAQQTGFRIKLDQTSPTVQTVHDTGARMGDTALTYTVPYKMPTGTAWTVTLWTYNTEGLVSAAQIRSFTVSYAPPPAVGSTLLASSTAGTITVTPAVLAPVGTQPAITSADLRRRVRTTAATLITNGSMAGTTTGYAGAGGTLSYSTTQFHDAPGAARLVPSGAAADSLVACATTNLAAVVAGQRFTVSAWIRPDTANKAIKVQITWYTAADAVISSVSTTVTNVVAAAWQFLSFTADSTGVANVAKVGTAIGLTSTPAAGDAFYADELTVRLANDDAGVRLVRAGAVSTPYADWGPASGVDYEYQWTAAGANGTSQAGPWTG